VLRKGGAAERSVAAAPARCSAPGRAVTFGGSASGGARTARTFKQEATQMAMSRSSSWKEHRLANRLEIDGTEYSVDLVARKATGIEGWKVTLVYLPRDAGDEVKVDLPNASSTAEVRRLLKEHESADDRLRERFREGRGG
jgi:hypothetical protein